MAHTMKDLQELQSYPLSTKIFLTKQRIREWIRHYGEDGVYVSFSGGKDSTVLLHLVREDYPSVPAVFVDTGLEYPEIRDYVKMVDNVTWLKPRKNFRQVIEEYGYPFISKEVSECVYAAKKYLTEIKGEMNLDRQTDRQTRHKWHYQKYRQLCGIGEYTNRKQGERFNIPNCENAGNVDERQPISDSGEYP